MTEKTYIDQLSELYEAILSDDCMPNQDKSSAIKKVIALEMILEKYSA